MTKIIKLIIGIIVVLLLCVGGFTYYNSTKQTSTQSNPNINPTNTNLDKSKDSTDNNKDKKDIDSKKATETTTATVKTDSTASTSNTNNNASKKVQEAPVSTKNNSNVNTSNYNNANTSSNTHSTVATQTNNKTSNNDYDKSELASLKTQCTNAFANIENEVNQINNQPNSDSYQITAQQNHIYNLWNNQLNYMYQRLEAILPHSTFESLNNSEVSWINYKINESSKFSDAGGSGGGAMRYYYKDAQLTKERCYYLYNNYIK